MSVLVYSTCTIQFIRNDEEIPEREYSDRSIVELRQLDDIDYSLRAVDVENKRQEIFNFTRYDPPTQCQFGEDEDEPDEIHDSNGVYRLWLNKDSRNKFHETLSTVFELLFPDETTDENSEYVDTSPVSKSPEPVNKSSASKNSEPVNKSPASKSSEYVNTSASSRTSNEKKKPVIPEPIDCNPTDILTDIRNLSKYIKQGKGDEAARMARELASQGIRLQGKSSKQMQNEEEFPILVQFDGNEYGIDQHGGTIPINVFPSTTIRELRATFEAAYHYSPTSQYFFVNGSLAHDDSTMRNLNVGPNSLFVLYLITYTKQFKTDGPWKCSSCSMANRQDNRKCQFCSAKRIE